MPNSTYPKIPGSNWWRLRDQFQKTLPSMVTTAYLKSLLGLNSDGAAQNLIRPLQNVGLIDDTNKPTDRANEWRNDAKYPEVCRAILEEVYPQELRDLYSGSGLDRNAVEAWFMDSAALGKGAAQKNTQFYALLNDATPQAWEKKQKSAAPKKSSKDKPKKSKAAAAAPPSSGVVSSTPARSASTVRPATANGPTIHLDFQVHISPDAGAEQIDAVFAAMAKHFPIK